jgi:hypothetical protein
VARFLCGSTGKTFSLLPRQLLPYCQYTIDAVVGTLFKVYKFQQIGQTGYHGASLELDCDCSVTPYLIQTWAMLILSGFLRGHHVLHKKYPLQTSKTSDQRNKIKVIYLYFQSISSVDSNLNVTSAIQYHFQQTGKCLFGRTSCDRIRSP